MTISRDLMTKAQHSATRKGWLKQLEELRIRDQLMVSLMEEDGMDPHSCFQYQHDLNIRYRLLHDLILRYLQKPKP